MFPFNDLPKITIFPYTAKNPAVSVNGKPFFCTGSFGSGRTALFTWLTGRTDNTRHGGISPFFAEAPVIPVQDYFYGMVIKAILWSTGRMPAIAITAFSCSENTAELTVDNRSGSALEVNFEIGTRHIGGMNFDPRLFVRKLEKGINRISLPLKFPYLSGVNLVDCRMKTGELYADFAVASVHAQKRSGIDGIEIPDRLYQENQSIPVKIQLAGKTDGLTLQLELRDSYGRLCFRAETQASGNTVSIPLKAERLYARCGNVKVSLYDGDCLLDRRETVVDLLPDAFRSREWTKYRVMMCWPDRGTRMLPFHLRPVWYDALKKLGIDAVLYFGIEFGWGIDKMEPLLLSRGDFEIVAESMSRLSWRSRIPGFTRQPFDYRIRGDELVSNVAKYHETRDKKYLRRNPSLEDESYIAEYSKALRTHLQAMKAQKLYPALYDLGDEMSYSYFSTPADLDFSEVSLKHFREWLKTRYRSIDELNAEWKRSYRDFSEVMPDTSVEARERGVYAGWGMHRIYATKVFSDFLRLNADIIRGQDPGAKITLSGSQPPNPFNGYDWTLLMPLLDSITAYSSSGMPEVLRSFKKVPLMGWAGYGTTRRELTQLIWNNAFNGHFGVGFYNEMAILNPDLTPTRHGQDLHDATVPLKNGVGSLLFNSTRKKPLVAVHYSQSSAVAAWIDQIEGDFSSSRISWERFLKSVGYNLRFVGTAEIENGILEKEGFKAFVMPSSIALSAGERSAIGKFAEKGGLVIADLAPGKYSARFVPETPSAFPGMILTGKLPGDLSAPAMKRWMNLFHSEISKRGGVVSQSVLKPSNGAETHAFDLSPKGGEVIALWNSEPGTVTVKRSADMHLYDALAHKEISGNSFPVEAHTPGVYVVLPYQVQGLDAEISRNGGEILIRTRVKTSRGPALRHVLHFEAFRDGKPFAPYSAVLEAPEGTAVHRIIRGIDEKETLKINITDIISGTTKEIVL